MTLQPWLIYALLSAAMAALVGVFAKMGMTSIDPTLATTIRSVIMTFLLVFLCGASGALSKLNTITAKPGVMILLSGIAGALSWLFYFRALQLGTVSQVAPIDKLSMPIAVVLAVLLLGDRPTAINWAGVVVMAGGAYLAAMPR
jgi:transporter family protein